MNCIDIQQYVGQYPEVSYFLVSQYPGRDIDSIPIMLLSNEVYMKDKRKSGQRRKSMKLVQIQ